MALSPRKIVKLKQLGIIILYWMVMLRIVILLNILGVVMIFEEFWRIKFIHIMCNNLWSTMAAGFAVGLFSGISELYLLPSYLKNKTMLEIVVGKIQKEIGLVPEFKGSINAGKVMVAEVGGYLKSEIAYRGDVLNTAARMLALAKWFPNKLIVSQAVKENLWRDDCKCIIFSEGKLKLRGENNTKYIYLIFEKNMQYPDQIVAC